MCVKILSIIFCCFEVIIGQKNIIVQTTNGPIRGKVGTTVGQNKTYYAYQGIPFAQPPVGDLRFRGPLPAKNWTGLLNATEEKTKCMQLLFDGSEDCLYLNVFSPVQTVPSKLLSVMVWIFGGYFLHGSGSQKEFGPDYFLEEDIVVVMFNYRVGIFGFLNTEDLASPGNYGLKDQILAIKWVKENIEYFGGNPDSITVFGESAGSVSICYLVQSPLTKGLFHKAIMQSGTTLNYFGFTRYPKEAVMDISKILGIFTDDTHEIVERLRKIDARVLELASLAVNVGLTLLKNVRNGIFSAPSKEIETPEAVVMGRSHELLKNGIFNRIPMMIGFNSEEGNTIMNALDLGKLYVSRYDIFPTDLLPVDLNIRDNETRKYVAQKIKEHYFGSTPVVFSDDKKLSRYITDDQFVRGITETVRLISNYSNVYFYRFSYKSNYSLQSDGIFNRKGVGHDEETDYIFNDSKNRRTLTASDNLTRKRLVRLWSNFAKFGNPTPTKEPLFQHTEWLKAEPTNLTYFDIGHDLTMQTDLNYYNIPWWFDLYAKYGIPPYDTF